MGAKIQAIEEKFTITLKEPQFERWENMLEYLI